jgi:hypothetical protein
VPFTPGIPYLKKLTLELLEGLEENGNERLNIDRGSLGAFDGLTVLGVGESDTDGLQKVSPEGIVRQVRADDGTKCREKRYSPHQGRRRWHARSKRTG